MYKICTFLILSFIFCFNVHCEDLTFGKFGTVTIYRPPSNNDKKPLVIFISGDGGWNQGVIPMAKSVANMGAIVAGVDIAKYTKALESGSAKCLYPAADFEALSKFIQKKLSLPHYQPPILVGYSSGATLVYALLTQAPAGTFLSGFSMGFCPDIEIHKPLCKGSGLDYRSRAPKKGYDILISKNLKNPWIVLQGARDQVCEPHYATDYEAAMPMAHAVMLEKVGHGFSVEKNWFPQFKENVAKLINSDNDSDAAIQDLPIVENPTVSDKPIGLAVLVTGDGGWAGIDRDIAQSLADNGISVIALDSLKYFWNPKTPEETAGAIDEIIKKYSAQYKQSKVMLVGYSLGADVLPFIFNRLSQESRSLVHLVALLGPDESVDFEFHLTDWVQDSSGKYHVIPEIKKMTGTNVLCLSGQDESDSGCSKLSSSETLHKVLLSGGHHFGGDYEKITSTILHYFAHPS